MDEKIWRELYERARAWKQAKDVLEAWHYENRFTSPDSMEWNSSTAKRARLKAEHAEVLLLEQVEAIEVILAAERG